MRKIKKSRLTPGLVPGVSLDSNVFRNTREPEKEDRANVMHFKWLQDDSVDMSRTLWLWSSHKKPWIKLQINNW